MLSKIHNLWNLGSVGRWTQYQSSPHDCTTHSRRWGLHISMHEIGAQTGDWWELNESESTQPRNF